MLSICKVALGGEDYYLATAASGRDHAEGLVEPAGVWLGRGAEQLGLTGVAEATAVRRLLRGQIPATGEELLAHPGLRRIAAFDCTFSVPKSVSIVHAFTPDAFVREEIRLAHEAAVEATLGYLNEVAGAYRSRGVDGPRIMPGDLAAVGFLHRLSRAGDPHLHTHVLVANFVLGAGPGAGSPGERAHALDATHLFHACRAAGALYETHLRYELTTRLCVEWQPLAGRYWSDLQGLDRAAVLAQSQRSVQIGEQMQLLGWQGRAAGQRVAELTRPPKELNLSYDEAIGRAKDRLWRAGVTMTRVNNVCFRRPLPPLVVDGWQDEALLALGRSTVDGTFTVPDVLRARCASARDGRSVAGVQDDVRELLADARVLVREPRPIRLRGGNAGSIPVGRLDVAYTTSSIVATEKRVGSLIRAMAAERPDSVAVLPYEAGDRPEALEALSGAVGRWREEGRSVLGVAPGRWAAAGMEASCGAETVVVPGAGRDAAPPRGQPRSGDPIAGVAVNQNSVVLVAEAHTYGPAVLGEIVSVCARAQASVVFLAPRHSLEQRRIFEDVLEVGGGRIPLSSVRQPADVPLRDAPEAARRHVFGSVDVTLVDSLAAAQAAAVDRLVTGNSGRSGPPAVLAVAGDEAVVATLRATPGVRSEEVVHARDLKDRLDAIAVRSGERPHLVVIGGAAVLRQGATAQATERRSHVVVAPGVDARSPEGWGRAAEAARPRYLVAQLGQPRRAPEDRAKWRAVAVGIEEHRNRWGITGAGRAFEPVRRPGDACHGGDRAVDRVAEQRSLERQATSVRSLGPDRSRREPPALGIGR